MSYNEVEFANHKESNDDDKFMKRNNLKHWDRFTTSEQTQYFEEFKAFRSNRVEMVKDKCLCTIEENPPEENNLKNSLYSLCVEQNIEDDNSKRSYQQ